LPNLLTELAGVIVDEYDPVGNDRQRVKFEVGDEFVCTQWCDVLSPTTAKTLAAYSSEYFAGRAAVTRNVCGKGTVYYVGTVLDDQATMSLLGRIAADLHVDCMPDLPEGVETAVRSSAATRLRFILNLTKERKCVAVQGGEWTSALTGERLGAGNLELAPGGVEILAAPPHRPCT
jgi:beta-galactosidase